MPQLAYILSLPRSGSTVLSAMLDRKKGMVSPPESSFPMLLGVNLALEALAKVKAAGVDFHYTIAGGGPELGSLLTLRNTRNQ